MQNGHWLLCFLQIPGVLSVSLSEATGTVIVEASALPWLERLPELASSPVPWTMLLVRA